MEEKKFLDVKLVAEHINVSKSLIYQMVSKNKIPYIKIGSRTIFDRHQVDQWLINGCRIVESLPELPKL
jgi:excisionase family DNA binding protein